VKWRVVFEGCGPNPHRVSSLIVGQGATTGNSAVIGDATKALDRMKVFDEIGLRLAWAMRQGGCHGFTVTVHPDGPDCDHG
jgi:hypothetical protein